MTKNPLVNAAAASAYIAIVVFFMSYFADNPRIEDTGIIGPIAILSLFTLSAAVMGFIFVSQPLMMYIDGNKKAAATLFMQTVALFAGITSFIFIGLLLMNV